MYKIYANGRPIFLSDSDDLTETGLERNKNVIVTPYLGKKKQIRRFLDLLDKNMDVEAVVLYSSDLETLWVDFKDCFHIIEAAGGYVLNAEGQLLVFYRRGSWDMPKGKIDEGETPEEAAVREVEEETGLDAIDLGNFIMHTWHTYKLKGERILKCTWWYHMRTQQTVVRPQYEEDIEEIHWVEPKAWMASQPEVYGSIRDVMLSA